jgi:hypothetical protein
MHNHGIGYYSNAVLEFGYKFEVRAYLLLLHILIYGSGVGTWNTDVAPTLHTVGYWDI